MRPLMTPDPICASCRSTFVERLENPADDPRDLQNRAPDIFDSPSTFPTYLKAFFVLVSSFFVSVNNHANPVTGSWRSNDSSPTRPRTPPLSRTHDNSSTSGLRFEFHSGPGGGSSRTFIIGNSNSLGRSPPHPDRPIPTMFEFLRREADNNNNNMRPPGDITGPLMAQYLLTLFGREPNGRGDPFAELLGMPPSAQWGDYVFNQEGWSLVICPYSLSNYLEALDQILAHLAETSTAGRPVAATDEIVSNLAREVLTEGSPLLERDCAVCKESFKLDVEDPDELVVVTLPCKHPFHEGCILPWLKSSGTCPVCRYALVPQPQQYSPPGPSGSGGNPNPGRSNSSTSTRPRSPGNSDRGGNGIFRALFGGGAGSSSGNDPTYSSSSQHNLGRANRGIPVDPIPHSTPHFPGRWIEDID
ncbi:hypothetical protein JVU11DRAFT_4905 [Chiua virens]|nr:hypothetical protein JVU11DRAFT_4905 [Chiua virens]